MLKFCRERGKKTVQSLQKLFVGKLARSLLEISLTSLACAVRFCFFSRILFGGKNLHSKVTFVLNLFCYER